MLYRSTQNGKTRGSSAPLWFVNGMMHSGMLMPNMSRTPMTQAASSDEMMTK